MGLDKARRLIAQRKAILLAAQIAKRARTGHVAPMGPHLPTGVAPPAGMAIHSVAAGLDRAPSAVGVLTIETRPAGADEDAWEIHEQDGNLVVTQAETIMAAALAAVANNTINYIELGDPSPATPPVLGDTGLEQTTAERKLATVTQSGNVLTAEVTWGVGEANGFTFTEAGLFAGLLGSGTMFARKVFNPIAKTAAFEMRFTWLITFLVNPSGSGDCAGVALLGPSTTASETVYTAAGGEASVAATFDFTVGAARVDVFLNGVRLIRGVHYVEANSPLAAPVGGPPGNKGVNFISFTLDGPAPGPADVIYLVHRAVG
jgi:hypothetical protein